ncbi:hypothetical protein HTSR_0278 [Halodesulfurarchaeum formicicum]|uniref:DUF502 domain-containing protein n=1 Tax=Halodesulfurarchaeum formicicum TaxID=1873524 RepID=A0A1D8S296_9EURY|nr:DUF502 domain-containing protein [Halodesulfurarchaeum formicicum]AOW79479.1 hypothetical protein HTSR_0278 [Halodesulfurarchaeum formicicum]APE94731.1 hypothetical protein HSR6_0264 [Halodesulfurarchaeum formicicum]
MATWKRDFASGLVVLLPILVTLYVVYWVLSQLGRVAVLSDVLGNPFASALLTLVVFVLFVFAVGYLMRTALGSILEQYIDQVFNRLPGLRVVYNASKMAVETALTGTEDLQAPVRLEVWEGMRMTAFKTGKHTQDGRDILFLPTAPNITTGYVIEVEPERYEAVDESVEEALTRVLSAGFGENESGDLAASLLDAGDDKDEEA